MYITSLTVILVFTYTFFAAVAGKCPPDDPSTVIEYQEIPEYQFDRNFSSISSSGKRPLGFDKATWYYNQAEQNPCVKITGASGRRIEVMFETHPNSRLCVKVQNADAECADAGTGSFYDCRRKATSDAVYLEFLCNQGEEYDVRFWYRLVLGPLQDDDPEDHWCDNRQQGDYPASLQRLPTNFPIDKVTTASPDAGLILHPCSLLVFIFAGLVSLVQAGL